MSEIILYPTETIYALGVNALEEAAWGALCALKGRRDTQPASWLVRNRADIAAYAEVSDLAQRLIDEFLPGPLTIVLPAKATVPVFALDADGMKSFRISPDAIAQKVIAEYMELHDAPLTCTSANLHGQPTLPTPVEILRQFGAAADAVTQVVDDGVRTGQASTVVRVIGSQVEILRPGAVPSDVINQVAGQ